RDRQPSHRPAAVGIPLFLRAGDAAWPNWCGKLGDLVGSMSGLPLLSILIAIPLIGGVICLFLNANGARWTALIATLLDFALSLYLWAQFNPDGAQWQFVEKAGLGGGVSWALGID